MSRINVVGLTKNSTNEEIQAKIGNSLENFNPVVYATEESKGGHKSLFVIQKVKIKGLEEAIQEGEVSFSQVAFAGASRDRLVRAIATVPKDYPADAGSVLANAEVRLMRNHNPFVNEAARIAGIPSQIVLNPKTGLVQSINGQPVYEHRTLIAKPVDKPVTEHDFSEMRKPADDLLEVSTDDVYQMLLEYGVSEERAAKAAQITFAPATPPTVV